MGLYSCQAEVIKMALQPYRWPVIVPQAKLCVCVCVCVCVLPASPLLSTVQIHDSPSVQVLRRLRLPHILLHIHRAGPRLAQVSLHPITATFNGPST